MEPPNVSTHEKPEKPPEKPPNEKNSPCYCSCVGLPGTGVPRCTSHIPQEAPRGPAGGMALHLQQEHSSKCPSAPWADNGKGKQMPFAFTGLCCLPLCNARVITHKCFVNRGVLPAAPARLGWSKLLWQGTCPSGAARCVPVA